MPLHVTETGPGISRLFSLFGANLQALFARADPRWWRLRVLVEQELALKAPGRFSDGERHRLASAAASYAATANLNFEKLQLHIAGLGNAQTPALAVMLDHHLALEGVVKEVAPRLALLRAPASILQREAAVGALLQAWEQAEAEAIPLFIAKVSRSGFLTARLALEESRCGTVEQFRATAIQALEDHFMENPAQYNWKRHLEEVK